MSIVGPHHWLDLKAVQCATCMAAPGEPCVTIREHFGPRAHYRGRGEPIGFFHAARGKLALQKRSESA